MHTPLCPFLIPACININRTETALIEYAMVGANIVVLKIAETSSLSPVTNSSINTQLTDAGGSEGTTDVDTQATTACDTGGLNCH